MGNDPELIESQDEAEVEDTDEESELKPLTVRIADDMPIDSPFGTQSDDALLQAYIELVRDPASPDDAPRFFVDVAHDADMDGDAEDIKKALDVIVESLLESVNESGVIPQLVERALPALRRVVQFLRGFTAAARPFVQAMMMAEMLKPGGLLEWTPPTPGPVYATPMPPMHQPGAPEHPFQMGGTAAPVRTGQCCHAGNVE